MKRVYFFVLLTSVSFLSFSQNLVVNPGFEIWEKSNKPSGWTTSQNCTKDSLNIRSGSYSCRHEGGTKYLGQTLSVVPGKHYRLSFFFKTAITGSGNGCRIWCYWKDLEINNITDPLTDDILRPSKYLKSEIWQQFTIDFIAPSLASFFYLEVRTYQNSIAYLDDFVFEENVTTLNPEEKLSDINIYPNPAHDYLIISNLDDLQSIHILSVTGIIVWSSRFPGEQTVTVPISEFPDGVYLIRIHASGKFINRKFIKETD
jgi:Secretion system C-terminal sorting domain